MALNGRFPDTMLAYLGWPEMDHLRLVPSAAASITRLAAAFEVAFGKPLYLSDAYRTLAQQVVLKKIKGKFAATPGTSNHGRGIAIDAASRINVDGSDEHRWMEANGPAYGWINPPWAVDANPYNGQHEPWHWEYKPALDTHPTPTQPVPVPAPHPPTHVQEDDMAFIIYARGGFWLKDGPRIDGLDAPTLESCRTAGLRQIGVTDALFDTWRDDQSPIPTLVRAPGRGVGLLGGAGGFTGLSSQDDVNRLRAAGAREIAVTDDDFDRLNS